MPLMLLYKDRGFRLDCCQDNTNTSAFWRRGEQRRGEIDKYGSGKERKEGGIGNEMEEKRLREREIERERV